jgi:hypothetical protein
MSDTLVVMSEKSFGIAGVTEAGRLVGVISDGDLRRNMAHLMERTAGEVATRAPRDRAGPAGGRGAGMMSENKITALFVTDAADRVPSGSSACTIACAPVWSEPPPERNGPTPFGAGPLGRDREDCQAQLSSSARRSMLEDVCRVGGSAGEYRHGVGVDALGGAIDRRVELADGGADGVVAHGGHRRADNGAVGADDDPLGRGVGAAVEMIDGELGAVSGQCRSCDGSGESCGGEGQGEFHLSFLSVVCVGRFARGDWVVVSDVGAWR